jgi:hypothetical protein
VHKSLSSDVCWRCFLWRQSVQNTSLWKKSKWWWTTKWFSADEVFFNESKTEQLNFVWAPSNDELNAHKLVGVVVDNKLMWSDDINILRLNLLKKAVIQMYCAFFYSRLTYTILMRSSAADCHLQRIFRIQNYVRKSSRQHSKPFFKQLQIMFAFSLIIVYATDIIIIL